MTQSDAGGQPMIQLIFLVSTAVNILSALYLMRQASRLRKANDLMRGVVEMLKPLSMKADGDMKP